MGFPSHVSTPPAPCRPSLRSRCSRCSQPAILRCYHPGLQWEANSGIQARHPALPRLGGGGRGGPDDPGFDKTCAKDHGGSVTRHQRLSSAARPPPGVRDDIPGTRVETSTLRTLVLISAEHSDIAQGGALCRNQSFSRESGNPNAANAAWLTLRKRKAFFLIIFHF